jgi:uncharacterized YigZ family protein
MKSADTYKTIVAPSQGLYKEKGSRFISFAIPVASADDIKSILEKYRKEYHDARHHCWAYMIGHDRSTWRSNDDGEPSGTAGRPILGQINSNGLTNILIVVIRYFGGTLLGTSGLINAYKTAAAEVIKNAAIVERTQMEYYRLEFPYGSMNSVMKILKDENINQSDQQFGIDCTILISFRSSANEMILNKFSAVDGVKLTYIKTA